MGSFRFLLSRSDILLKEIMNGMLFAKKKKKIASYFEQVPFLGRSIKNNSWTVGILGKPLSVLWLVSSFSLALQSLT